MKKIVIILFIISLISEIFLIEILAFERPLGDNGKADDYEQTIENAMWRFPDMGEFRDFVDQLPQSFDWRDKGVVTPAKDQGWCGSCWAFAVVGALESKILMKEGVEYDLSEQQLVSCADDDLYCSGCNGGTSRAIFFWNTVEPMEESCSGYEDYNFDEYPLNSSVFCGDLDRCGGTLPYNTKGYYTVDTNDINEIKTSLSIDGPAYFRYDVWSDFYTFWKNGFSGEVYTHTDGEWRGGHAVLIIGWDDDKAAWLCKNSWGATDGPNGDGTFWIAYMGHKGGFDFWGRFRDGLEFGMANFKITGHTNPKPPIADAGSDQTVKSGARVTLDGSGSRDMDDGIVSYLWEQKNGPGVSISKPDTIKPAFTAPDAELSGKAMTFSLTVTDNSGAKDTDTCSVYVLPPESPALSVTPVFRDVSSEAGTVMFNVSNTGQGVMKWTVSANDSWLHINSGSSGTNAGIVSANCDINTGGYRVGTLTITAAGATNSPMTVEIRQQKGATGIYQFERMWPTMEQPWYFDSPYAITVDGQDNIYVANSGNGYVYKLNSEGTVLAEWDFDSNGLGIALDNDGNIYITTTYSIPLIKKFNAEGKLILEWGIKGFDSGEFIFPSGITVDNKGYVYIADMCADRIQKFDSEGVFITQWESGGLGSCVYTQKPYGYSMSYSTATTGMSTDTEGNIYVKDGDTYSINKYKPDGTLVSEIGGEDSYDKTIYGDGIAIDKNGNIYVSSYGIKKFTYDGTSIERVGDFGSFSVSDGIALDSFNNIYAADSSNDRILKINSDGSLVATWGNDPDKQDSIEPTDMVMDAAGNIYAVDDSDDCVKIFNKDGIFIEKNNRNSGVRSIAIDTDGNIYGYKTHIIQKFNSNWEVILEWGGEGTGDGEFDTYYNVDIAIDKQGNVYAAETGTNRIQKFTSDGKFLTKWGTEGSGDGEFDRLSCIAIDEKGYIYTGESYPNYRIQKFTSDGKFVSKFETGNDSVSGIAIDDSGNIYLSSSRGNAVRKYSSEGELLTSFGKSGSGAGELNSPQAICISPDDKLYVADYGNNRIQVFMNKPGWVKISGTVSYGGVPLSSMILANGQYMFTSSGNGQYELDVPLDENGKITLFSFCDGLAPFSQILTPEEATGFDIKMFALADSSDMILTATAIPLTSDKARINGIATFAGNPLSIMVLANGQHMFTNSENGQYELEVPLDENGKITLFGFCDGLAPFKQILVP